VLEAKDRVLAVRNGPVTLAAFGLAYKPDIDDLRESPAWAVAAALAREKNLRLLAVEPHIRELPPILQDNEAATLAEASAAAAQADILLFLVRHSAFKPLAANLPQGKIIIDTVGMP